MLGTVTEAEEVVQQAFLRYHSAVADGSEIDSSKAYLSALTTRLAIDRLRSPGVVGATYAGDPSARAETDIPDSLSMAVMRLLEQLNPEERAVFLLRDLLSFPFDEIGQIVDRNESDCREMVARARSYLSQEKPRDEA